MKGIRPNVLGDTRAEADSRMLDRAFLETPDYRTLIETSDRLVVIGRRGTGKSALRGALARHWMREGAPVVELVPHEHQAIALRPIAQLFGEAFSRVRAGTRLLWRYALLVEVAKSQEHRSSFNSSPQFAGIKPHIDAWEARGRSILDRFRSLAREVLEVDATPEDRIGDLPGRLNLTQLEELVAKSSTEFRSPVVFLIDSLDEGYEPDDIGVGLVDGLVQAAIDLKTRIDNLRLVLFLRDNIFRSVQSQDPDYSRVIEGHEIRLHWDENALLAFAAARLKIAFSTKFDGNQKIWDACTLPELHGRDGFLRCLRLTLYRPRDVLALLNEAFFLAQKNGQTLISIANVDDTAQSISKNRFDDLAKEYSATLPGLRDYTDLFRNNNPERKVSEVAVAIETLLSEGSSDSRVQQDFFILDDPKSVLRALYGIGFLGVRDVSSGRMIFCHDGSAPTVDFVGDDAVLVHPCYWIALNCTIQELDAKDAEDIYDEYDIEVASETPGIRRQKILALISQLDNLPEGTEGDRDFEVWCQKALRICFVRSIRNVALRPNKLASLRRDVVGTNLGEGKAAWRRIRDDYGTRHVVFEIKNYRGIGAADFQQVVTYLGNEYGRLGFIVTRDDSVDLFAHRDVEWVRSIYMMHKMLVIKLTGSYLRKLLYKLINPTRHDDVDDAIHKILDTYERLYLSGQTMTERKAEQRVSRKKQRKMKSAGERPK